ncbi:MAG: PriCT-2 domain-containing protein [Burkholderiaceae bacterium]|nr:PriCT-2 domain-containing protein [Burkholderiaceae bacterium]
MSTAADNSLARLLNALGAGAARHDGAGLHPTTRAIVPATRTAPLNLENIPKLLKDAPKWVAHRAKRPIDPKTGRAADVSNAATWGTFGEAIARLQSGKADGVGYVFTEDDGLVFIDLDHVISDVGAIAPWAQPLVDAALRSRAFVEVSPSGSGLHIIVRGAKPFAWSRKSMASAQGEAIGAIEAYDRKRYATVTGRLVDGASTAMVDGAAILDEARRLGEQGAIASNRGASALADSSHGNGFSSSHVGALSSGVFDAADGRIKPRTPPVTVDIELAPRAALELRKLADALAYVDASPYESWLGVVHALAGASEVGTDDERRALAVAWSRTAPDKFDGAESVERAFDSHQARPGEITTASIYKAARAAGWRWDDRAEAAALLDDAGHTLQVRRASIGEFVLIAGSGESRRPIVLFVPSDAGERAVFGAMVRLGVKKPTMTAARAHLDKLIAAAVELPAIDVYVRVARIDDAIVHDLGGDNGLAIITRAGSVSVAPAPETARFMIGDANGRLPQPAINEVSDVQRAARVLDEWYAFAGVPDLVRPLLTAWLAATLQPDLVTPILEVSGPPGSGKTILAAQLQQLIDPGATPGIRSARLRPEDIAAAAAGFYTIGVDNVSRLTADESDLLCQVTTGATLVCRRLYEQRSSVALSIKRPVLLTSITPVLVRSDAADRAIVVELPPRRLRVDEQEVNARFDAMRPRALAAVHRVLAAALSCMSQASTSSAYRLAGFARLGRAISLAMGGEASGFDHVMEEMKRRQAAGALDAGSLGGAILKVVQGHVRRAVAGEFKAPTRANLRAQVLERSTLAIRRDGRCAVFLTGEALRQELVAPVAELAIHGIESELPRTARGLWDALRRLTPVLSAIGVALQIEKYGQRQMCAVFTIDEAQGWVE